ncbi:hypothetical protein [Nonomuraea sp. NPDC046570]|uniref:hypothetical protein n=1 Tax=Nonomuraea sp. NPDC046570 TaxID=3155255 RepID=UPI003401FC58
MLAFALGLTWLVLAPVCLWLLVRGRNPARAGAVLALAALEVATVVGVPDEAMVVAYDVPPQPVAVCAERMPVPRQASLAPGRLVLSWPAAADECGTASVVLRERGRTVRVWVHEGPLRGHHEGVVTVPVRVAHGTASLSVPVTTPASRPADGRSGRRIKLVSGTAESPTS